MGSLPTPRPKRTPERPVSAPASARVPTTPYTKRSPPKFTRSLSPRKNRSASPPRARSAPANIRGPSPRRPSPRRASPPRKKTRGYGRLARGLVSMLAFTSLLGGAYGPRNGPRVGGRPNRPQETRLMPYRNYKGPYHTSIYNINQFPVSVINYPRMKGENQLFSSIERKMAPGKVIGKNIVKARPVYLRSSKYGPVLVGMSPPITPEQARMLLSRGFKFSTKNIQNKVLRGELVDPNMNLNVNTRRMLEDASALGKRGINAYPRHLQGQIRKLKATNPYLGTFEPAYKTKALPK